MKVLRIRWATLFALCAGSAFAQTTPFSCTVNAGVPPILRLEGYTEMVGDWVLLCSGGTPTPKGRPYPR